MLIIFTYLRIDSVFGSPEETFTRAQGKFCWLGGPQISSFFIDNAKVLIFHVHSK